MKSKCTFLQPLIPSVFQQHEAAGACPARGHTDTKFSFGPLGLPVTAASVSHIRVTRGDRGAGLMASSRHGQGELPPPQWSCPPCDARLSGKAQLCPCSVNASSQSPVTLSPGQVKVQVRAGSRVHKRCSASPAHTPRMGRRRQWSQCSLCSGIGSRIPLGEHKLLFPWWFYKLVGKPQLSPSMTNANITSLLP